MVHSYQNYLVISGQPAQLQVQSTLKPKVSFTFFRVGLCNSKISIILIMLLIISIISIIAKTTSTGMKYTELTTMENLH